MSALLTAADPRQHLLVTPGGKHHRTLLLETWKKILRLQRDVKAEGFRATFTCPDCDQPISMTVPSKSAPQLECRCTTWIGR